MECCIPKFILLQTPLAPASFQLLYTLINLLGVPMLTNSYYPYLDSGNLNTFYCLSILLRYLKRSNIKRSTTAIRSFIENQSFAQSHS